MISLAVVVRNELTQCPAKVSLAEEHEAIEALLP
jgi:hypothetical protein